MMKEGGISKGATLALDTVFHFFFGDAEAFAVFYMEGHFPLNMEHDGSSLPHGMMISCVKVTSRAFVDTFEISSMFLDL